MKNPIILIFLLVAGSLSANNLQINNPAVDPDRGTLSFSLSWENSWHMETEPGNWDAIWVFIKSQSCDKPAWEHAKVSALAADHSVSGDLLQVDAVDDSMGVFIRRSNTGFGPVAPETVTLKMVSGVNTTDNYQIFGIEMVCIPEGEFFLGDGTKGFNEWSFGQSEPPGQAVLITAERQQTGILGNCDIFPDCKANGVKGGILPPGFPLGYSRFYTMKYEISQAQYSAFLNTLTFAQQVNRTASSPSAAKGTPAISYTPPEHNRNAIRIQIPGIANNEPALYACDLNGNGIFNEADDGQNIACNYLSWPDLLAYLDWSALRPMTEFEFEKICRGEAAVTLAGEYAWGNAEITQATSANLDFAGTPDEISRAGGNGLCAFGAESFEQGPLRCGFAAGTQTNRQQAGAGFYGVMDMSGNVAEQCVGGQKFDYSGFTSENGNGQLTTKGAADTRGWPAKGGGQFGGIIRGGNWHSSHTTYLKVSDRSFLELNHNQGRDNRIGGRGVRSW